MPAADLNDVLRELDQVRIPRSLFSRTVTETGGRLYVVLETDTLRVIAQRRSPDLPQLPLWSDLNRAGYEITQC
jgi:hypothetical protein